MGEDDNFWPASAPSQGPDGVCGPCSEVFYRCQTAMRSRYGILYSPNTTELVIHRITSDHFRVGISIQAWGLERTCAMLQGVDSNFHIDILLPLVETVADTCKQSISPVTTMAAEYAELLTMFEPVRLRFTKMSCRAIMKKSML